MTRHVILLSKRTGIILRVHARAIQRLGRRVIADVVEIGRRLNDAKNRLGHGKFLTWLVAEFGWSERTAENFMRVYDLYRKSEKFADLQVPISALYLLAAPSTPDKALEEVATRIGNGNDVSLAEVKDIIDKSRRGSSLRHLIRVALQILGVMPCDSRDWDQVLDRHLAGADREQVLAIVHRKCSERLERREASFSFSGRKSQGWRQFGTGAKARCYSCPFQQKQGQTLVSRSCLRAGSTARTKDESKVSQSVGV